jgi:hypothetical protein
VEERSFINLVNWYRDELIQILNGEKVSTIIEEKCRREGLTRNGVLLKGGIVSEKARRILEE